MKPSRVGFIGRFKPLHNGGAVALEAICRQAAEVIIGLGSSNKYNLRNPFTAEESRGMLEAFLTPRFANYSFVEVPDFAHLPEYADGQQWRKYILEHFGTLNYFFTGNLYVKQLLEGDYPFLHPASLLPQEKMIKLRATEVRVEIARGGNWQSLVPLQVADYLERNSLVERFRREFGRETLSALLDSVNSVKYTKTETAKEEQSHAREV